MLMDIAQALVVAVAGCGGVGVVIAWLNDKREISRARLTPIAEPKRILETRFAKGEIDADDFQRRMHALTYGPPLDLPAGQLRSAHITLGELPELVRDPTVAVQVDGGVADRVSTEPGPDRID